MNQYSLTHVPDPALLRELKSLLAQDRATTALLLAHLAEVDARKLYAAAGYPSLFAWCVETLHFSEDVACSRIRVARIARQFPAIFTMLADGRLHLTAVTMLAPWLGEENADGLLSAAAHRSKVGIEQLLAERFPRPDLPDRIEGLVLPPSVGLSVPERMKFSDTQLAEPAGSADLQLAPERVESAGAQHAPGHVWASGTQLAPGPVKYKVAPLSPGRYGLQFTVAQATYEKLRYAQALLGHSVPSGELAEVLDRALDALIDRLKQRKFAATARPRQHRRRESADARYIPAEVRREVWERDGGRCTFVSDAGHRCESRTRLEFDHVEPVAREGGATVKNLRLRCRTHNQYAAERDFGVDFMSHMRDATQRAPAAGLCAAADAEAHALATAADDEARVLAVAAAEEARAHAAAAAEEARARAAAVEEVVPWLRALGLRLDEARRAAARCEAIPDASLEERLRCALKGLARPARVVRAAAAP